MQVSVFILHVFLVFNFKSFVILDLYFCLLKDLEIIKYLRFQLLQANLTQMDFASISGALFVTYRFIFLKSQRTDDSDSNRFGQYFRFFFFFYNLALRCFYFLYLSFQNFGFELFWVMKVDLGKRFRSMEDIKWFVLFLLRQKTFPLSSKILVISIEWRLHIAIDMFGSCIFILCELL